MQIRDRYSRAVHSSDLKAGNDARHEDASANLTDTDVLGAHAFAAKKARLAIALQRLFVGDSRAVHSIVLTLVEMIMSKAHAETEYVVTRAEATDIARAVLAWHRDGNCKPCPGLGFLLHDDAPVLSAQQCQSCRGTRKMPFDVHFSPDQLVLALWIRDQIEREQAIAGGLAMKKLAARMDEA